MFFHVTLDHTPEACPVVTSGNATMPAMLARADETGVKVVGAFAGRPQHRVFFVLETDDVAKLSDFLDPALSWTKCEIDPVNNLTP